MKHHKFVRRVHVSSRTERIAWLLSCWSEWEHISDADDAVMRTLSLRAKRTGFYSERTWDRDVIQSLLTLMSLLKAIRSKFTADPKAEPSNPTERLVKTFKFPKQKGLS